MSNHSGGRMLNKILNLLDQEQVFAFLEEAKIQSIIKEINSIACREYDCNSSEIMEGLGERFGLFRRRSASPELDDRHWLIKRSKIKLKL